MLAGVRLKKEVMANNRFRAGVKCQRAEASNSRIGPTSRLARDGAIFSDTNRYGAWHTVASRDTDSLF